MTGLRQDPTSRACILGLWLGLALALLAAAAVLTAASPLFDWQREVRQMPAATLGVALAGAGLGYALLLPLVRRTLALPAAEQRAVLALVLLAGLAARGLLLLSEPAMEDDYNRYLWEGALTANGINPYAISPADAGRADPATRLGTLAEEGAAVLARVNYPELTSTYPPVAQAAFAVAHLLAPWSLDGWRMLALTFDCATLGLLLVLLGMTGRSRLWVVLYWWSPLVIKELVNSAHMDGLIVVAVLASLLLSARGRHVPALLLGGVAIGSKLWPALLVPLLLRPLWTRPRALIAGVALIGAMTALWMLPAWLEGPHANDGFVAYARYWRTNSALFPAFEDGLGALLSLLSLQDKGWLAARGIAAGAVGGLALYLARAPIQDAEDVLRRAGIVTLCLLLASPSQFPWYAVWTIPFTVFRPRWSVVAMTVTLPLYYTSFHFIARDTYAVFSGVVVWLIWLPVWLLVLLEARGRGRPAGDAQKATS